VFFEAYHLCRRLVTTSQPMTWLFWADLKPQWLELFERRESQSWSCSIEQTTATVPSMLLGCSTRTTQKPSGAGWRLGQRKSHGAQAHTCEEPRVAACRTCQHFNFIIKDSKQ
jgi:hypothetical protein